MAKEQGSRWSLCFIARIFKWASLLLKRVEADMKGAILGVGLHMIEESFSEKKSQSSNSTTETPPAKRRRKSGILAAAQAQAQAQSDQDEDDDIEVDDYADGVGLGVGGKGGRRLAAGTGYSGAASEDVSLSLDWARDYLRGITWTT